MTHVARPDVNPLNQTLYALLQHKFGDVRISNPGSSAVVQRVRDPLNPKRTLTQAAHWGEYYTVCCPFCNDVGHKLWINYMYGVDYDRQTGRRTGTHLAVCYKNSCTAAPGRLAQLEDLIFGPGKRLLARLPIREGVVDTATEQIEPPGEILSLLELPETAPAVQYLNGRQFDIEMLANVFDVGVCVKPAQRHPAMRGRIYIPSYFNRRLVAFQGRAPTTQDVKMKYYTWGTKSRALYNYDAAAAEDYLVIVEGAPSVWRHPRATVSVFGKSLSAWQENTIATTWISKPVFIVLDHGEEAALEAAAMRLCRHNLHVIPVLMPDTRDPADYSSAEFRDLLAAAADSVEIVLPRSFW
jgi:hypothetical protein